MAGVQLVQVTKRYGAQVAVHDLSLDIGDRLFVSLVGPSGCGKTTTLRMIAGLERGHDGAIWFDRERVDHLPANHRDIAMVFQTYALYPNMDVRANMGFPLRMAGMQRSLIEQRVSAAAHRLGIGELLDRKPRQLSGGQRQRVALGRAIVREPAVFLMDEPLSNLDAQLRVEMRAELRRLHFDLARTFVYVTHDQAEALTMSDLIAVMDRGRLQQVGPPDEVYNRPSNLMVAGFIGSPQMNFLRGELAADGDGRTMFHSSGAPLMLPLPPERTRSVASGQQVVLGVRPEAVGVGAASGPLCLEGSVYVSEPLGSDSYVTARFGEQLVKARTTADRRCQPGEPVTFGFDPARFHLFDAASGQALRLEA